MELKALANRDRLLIVFILKERGPMSFKELAEAVEKKSAEREDYPLGRSYLVYHLEILEQAGLVERLRKQKWSEAVYRLTERGRRLLQALMQMKPVEDKALNAMIEALVTV